jgi:hypothetical protein
MNTQICVACVLLAFATGTVRGGVIVGTPSAVSALNSSASDQVGAISLDGLTIYLGSRRSTVNERLYSTSRPNLASAFGPPTNAPFLNINSSINTGEPVISADGLTLFYATGGGVINDRIFTATRPTLGTAFGPGSIVPNVNFGDLTRPSWLSADGLRLYLSARVGDLDLYVATRPDLSSPFETPTDSVFTGVNTSFAELEATLTPDELNVFFTSNRPGGVGSDDIWWASRPNVTSAFGAALNLTALNSTASDRGPVFAGSEIFFNSTRANPAGGFNALDIYSAPISMTAVVPEPSCILLFAGAMGIVGAFIGKRP